MPILSSGKHGIFILVKALLDLVSAQRPTSTVNFILPANDHPVEVRVYRRTVTDVIMPASSSDLSHQQFKTDRPHLLLGSPTGHLLVTSALHH